MITQVRFHGAAHNVPPTFRDAQPATIEGAKLEVTKLEAEKACLDKQLGPLLDKVQSGDATTEEMATVADLSEDVRIVAGRLHRANVELTVAEEKQARKDAETKRKRFNELVIEALQKRSEFARLYKETCVVLGSLCASVDEASRIANSFAADSVAGMLPTDRNVIAELSERIDPLASLLDSGLAPTTEFGWDCRIAVVPLKGLTK